MMTFLNRFQLREKYPDVDYRNAFGDLYSLSLFYCMALAPQEYRPPDSITDAITLTPEGTTWARSLSSEFPNLTPAETKLAVFMVFSHQELFIDIEGSSVEVLQNALNFEILSRAIRFPWVFGRYCTIDIMTFGQIIWQNCLMKK